MKSGNIKVNHPYKLISAEQWQSSGFRRPAMVAFVQHLVADIDQGKAPVPAMSTLGKKLIELCEQDQPSMTNIADLASMDFAFTRRVIDYANKCFPEDTKTDSILNAVHRIGPAQVRNIMVAKNISEFLMHHQHQDLSDRFKVVTKFMVHNAAVATLLAGRANGVRVEDALLGGLVALVGMLPILARYDQHPESLHDLAMLDQVMIYDHAKVGAALLKSWDLPKQFCNVPQNVSDLTRISYSGVTLDDVATVAMLHAHLGKKHPLSKIDWKSVPAVQKVRMSPEDTLNLMQHVRQRIEETEWLLA